MTTLQSNRKLAVVEGQNQGGEGEGEQVQQVWGVEQVRREKSRPSRLFVQCASTSDKSTCISPSPHPLLL